MASTCVLVVEDEPINRELLTENLSDEGYAVVAAEDGTTAWALIEAAPSRFDVILLDRMMPDMDGIELLRRIRTRSELDRTPVVMQTARSADEDIAEGLRAGAYYYLTKPFSADTLLAIVAAAAREREQQLSLARATQQTAELLRCLQRGEFRFRTPAEARDLATLAANAAPDAGRVVLGLSELLLNAVEHGNLALSYDEKSALLQSDGLHEELARRLTLPAFANRYATLEIERAADEIRFLIRDQGAGFAWERYLDITPERAFDTHGRGIAMARMISFDRIEYRGCGNEVLAAVTLPAA